MSQQEISNVTETTHSVEYLHGAPEANDSTAQRMFSLLDELESEAYRMQHPRTSTVIDLIIFLRQQLSYPQHHRHQPSTTDRQASINHELQASRYWDYP